MIRYLLYAISLAICFACQSGKDATTETCLVKRGEFKIDLMETGELNATNSVNITSPSISWQFGMLKINQIVDDGTEVNKGDTVALFDPSEVFKVKIDATAEMEIAMAELDKLRAEQSLRVEDLEADLKINEINFEIAKIQLAQAKHESEITKKEIQLNLNKTEIDLKKAGVEIENQKKIHKEEEVQALLKIKQLRAKVDEADKTIAKLTVVSPAKGIVIIGKNWSTGNKWQVGDQPWSGTPLIHLPDLTEYKVDVDINEVDVAKIKVGQKAEIRLDAFSDEVYTGRVKTVATLANFKDEKSSKIKVFPTTVILDRTSEDLLPGMTVSSRIIIDKIPDVLYIPIEAVYKNGAIDYVYVKSGSGFEQKEVITGQANTDYVIIDEGLEEGDVLALNATKQNNEEEKNK